MKENLGIRLANLILVVILISFTVASLISFSQKSYISGICLLLVGAFLLLSFRWSAYGRVSLILFLIFFYLLAYATNVFLIFTNKKGTDELKKIEAQRIQAARQMGRGYDTRSTLQVVADLQASGVDAVPMLAPISLLATNGLPDKGRRLLPLAGIALRTTVFCNECGNYSIYQADEHGFNNPSGLWPPQPIDLLLIGDSFCHGGCVPPGDDVGSVLRASGQRVLNLGYSAEGPLLELATLREYGPAIKPKKVFWLYFEGNDLDDLEREKRYSSLTQYLRDGTHTQDLIHRQGEIDRALTGYLEKGQVYPKRGGSPWYRHKKLLEALRSFQLKNLKSGVRLMHLRLHEYLYHEDVQLFKETLAKAQATVQSWHGHLYFVYLPDYRRYSGQDQVYPLNRRDLIISTAQNLGIPLIDFHPTVANLPDPLAVFPFRKAGHYNKEGYRLLAREILATLQGSSSASHSIKPN